VQVQQRGGAVAKAGTGIAGLAPSLPCHLACTVSSTGLVFGWPVSAVFCAYNVTFSHPFLVRRAAAKEEEDKAKVSLEKQKDVTKEKSGCC
jgi:hypothetical protein